MMIITTTTTTFLKRQKIHNHQNSRLSLQSLRKLLHRALRIFKMMKSQPYSYNIKFIPLLTIFQRRILPFPILLHQQIPHSSTRLLRGQTRRTSRIIILLDHFLRNIECSRLCDIRPQCQSDGARTTGVVE